MLAVFTCKRNGSCRDVEEELCECFLQCIVTFSKCYSLWFMLKVMLKELGQKLYCNSHGRKCHHIE